MPESQSQQSTQLQEVASEAGNQWAISVRTELAAEGRRPVGLWPGTLSEARTRAIHLIANKRLGITAGPDREQMVRVLYDAARNSWLGWREREE